MSTTASTITAAQKVSPAKATAKVQPAGELQHNYVVFPGDANGNALANLLKDPLMQKYWPEFEGHTTDATNNSNSSWVGDYDYISLKRPSYEEDFAAPATPIGPAYASGLAIAFNTQPEMDAALAAIAAKFPGGTANVGSEDTTLDVKDRGDSGERRFNEFERHMVNAWPNNGIDGKPAFAGNFSAWLTIEKTMDGTGTETIRQVVSPHLQSGKLPQRVASVTYALGSEDFANTEALLACCGFRMVKDGNTDVWIPHKPGVQIRLEQSDNPNFQGLVARSYVLNKDALKEVRRAYGKNDQDGDRPQAIQRDFGYGVSLVISATEPRATLWIQKPPAATTPAATKDSFDA